MKTIIKDIWYRFKFFCSQFLRVGFFLSIRQIKRSNISTTVLIIFIMTLTFMNLVVVNGILVGLVEGSSIAYRSQYSGDILISQLENKNFISQTNKIENRLRNSLGFESLSKRILFGGKLEANYRDKNDINDKSDQVSVLFTGIDPRAEDQVTNLSSLIVEGEYLRSDDVNSILLGSNLLERYSSGVPGSDVLSKVEIGSKLRMVLGQEYKEFKVKGIIKSKVGDVGQRVFMIDSKLRKIIERPDFNVNEIAIKLKLKIDPYAIKDNLEKEGLNKYALIQTWQESQGQFFRDISMTFNLLGLMVGAIGVVVASITIFIVIFINAVSRRRYIGILKGIGICGRAIEAAYIIQALFYVLTGVLIGLILLYLFLKPYINANPIDFPFSDGILVAPLKQVFVRVGVLILITLIAGYLPVRRIVAKNTLDTILGR